MSEHLFVEGYEYTVFDLGCRPVSIWPSFRELAMNGGVEKLCDLPFHKVVLIISNW